MKVEGIIGIFQWEREVRQVISVDIEMDFDNTRAGKSDSIDEPLIINLSVKELPRL